MGEANEFVINMVEDTFYVNLQKLGMNLDSFMKCMITVSNY